MPALSQGPVPTSARRAALQQPQHVPAPEALVPGQGPVYLPGGSPGGGYRLLPLLLRQGVLGKPGLLGQLRNFLRHLPAPALQLFQLEVGGDDRPVGALLPEAPLPGRPAQGPAGGEGQHGQEDQQGDGDQDDNIRRTDGENPGIGALPIPVLTSLLILASCCSKSVCFFLLLFFFNCFETFSLFSFYNCICHNISY